MIRQLLLAKTRCQRWLNGKVVQAVKRWRMEADRLEISAKEQDKMARAFSVADSYNI